MPKVVNKFTIQEINKQSETLALQCFHQTRQLKKVNHPTDLKVNKILLHPMLKFFIIASPKFRTKFSGHHHFNEIPSFFNILYSTNMKQTFSKACIYICCIA